jgi:hypothetical protein
MELKREFTENKLKTPKRVEGSPGGFIGSSSDRSTRSSCVTKRLKIKLEGFLSWEKATQVNDTRPENSVKGNFGLLFGHFWSFPNCRFFNAGSWELRYTKGGPGFLKLNIAGRYPAFGLPGEGVP